MWGRMRLPFSKHLTSLLGILREVHMSFFHGFDFVVCTGTCLFCAVCVFVVQYEHVLRDF